MHAQVFSVRAPVLDARSCLQRLAEKAAFTPYGTSTAAAIVACCLYFLFLCCAIANFAYTKYPFYDVLIISTACEPLLLTCVCMHIFRSSSLLLGRNVKHHLPSYSPGCFVCQFAKPPVQLPEALVHSDEAVLLCSQDCSFWSPSCLHCTLPTGSGWNISGIQQRWIWCQYSNSVPCFGNLVFHSTLHIGKEHHPFSVFITQCYLVRCQIGIRGHVLCNASTWHCFSIVVLSIPQLAEPCHMYMDVTLSVLLCRLHQVGHLYYGKKERVFYTVWAYALVAAIIIFGRKT